MARNEREIEKEIQRIEGQLLVAKHICRENLKEINHLKSQQKNDLILQEINQLLSIRTLDSNEHVTKFNKLLEMIDEQQQQQTNTLQYDEQDEKNEQYNALLADLSSNITELESLFDYGKNLFTQPITSVNMLDNTNSLQNIADDCLNDKNQNEQQSININDLQNRIDIMQKRLIHIHQIDDCFIQ